MKLRLFLTLFFLVLILACQQQNQNIKSESKVKYNIIEPANGIYAIIKKNVNENELTDKFYEKLYYKNNKLTKIERYNTKGNLTDDLSVAAISVFEYNTDGKVKYLKYFDKNNNRAKDKNFGYWSIEYIYDEFNRVRMEIYRDENSKFLEVPRDNKGKIAKVDFLSPVLTYEYLGDKLLIKALDKNFNLLKEVVGDKPCVPFIDCGDNE